MATTTLTAFLAKFNNLTGDNLSGTTDSAGNVAKTTFIDSALSKYDDNYFGDPERNPQWWAYIASELRSIKGFTSSSGTVEVHKAFTSQVGTATAYQIHKYDRDKKIIACNQALNECYPHFYKRIEDATTLDGKGASDNKYTVPVTFTEFPCQIWSIDDDGTEIVRTLITNYQIEEIGGLLYFYANITEDEDILLIGKKPLTAFTTDASTTELSDLQAETVALLAVSIFFRNLSGVVNATDSGRFDSLANRYQMMYEDKRITTAMPVIQTYPNWEWANEG